MAEIGFMTPQATGNTPKPVGLLAGWGRFPILFAEKAREQGLPVVCVGITDEASPKLADLCQRFDWSHMFRLGRTLRLFKRAGVEKVVMAGKIHKFKWMYGPWTLFKLLPDWRTFRVWYGRRRPDNRDDTLLLAIVREFAKEGMEISSALDLCPELLVPHGNLTRRALTVVEQEDIAFGWEVAREIGRHDIGQSVAVKNRTVLAVEAIEGTDRAITRAGELCRSDGFVVVKVAKPNQDMRFDVPTVGCSTIETMRQAGARVLAIEADKTIILDQADTVALADRYGMTIIALREAQSAAA